MKLFSIQARIFFVTFILQVIFLVNPLKAQSPLDDLLNNQMESFQRKILLLDASYSDYPYLAFYLREARQVKASSIELLLKQGANPNIPDDKGVFPIHLAVLRGDLEIVKKLIDAGAKLTDTIRFDTIFKYWSRESGNRSMRIYDFEYVTPVQLSVIIGVPALVEHFLEFIDPDTMIQVILDYHNTANMSLLEIPLWTSDGKPDGSSISTMKLLLTKSINVDKAEIILRLRDYDQLLISILYDDVAMLKKNLLLTRKDPKPYIVYSVLAGSMETLDFLLRYEGLSYSSEFEVPISLKYGSLSFTDYYWGKTPIPLYAYPFINGNAEMVAYIKAKGADISREFILDSFDEVSDIDREYRISGIDYQSCLKPDEAMLNALK